jgi:hypothetical protein
MLPTSETADLLSSAEARQILALSQSTFSRLVLKGDLKAAHRHNGPRGAYVFRRTDVEELAAKRAASA